MSTPDLRAQGLDALREQRFDAAADLLNRHLDDAPQDAEAELALAAARAGQGKHAAALVIYERHLERSPRSPALHFNRGSALERLGRRADAIQAYEQALRLKPDHAKARQRLQALRGGVPPTRSHSVDEPTVHDQPPAAAPADSPEDEVAERAKAKARRRTAGDRYIHPAGVVALLVFAVAVSAAAGKYRSAYAAGEVAGGELLGSIFFLFGLQTLHYARRGSKNRPAGLGYACAALGVCLLIGAPLLSVYQGVREKQQREARSAEVKARQAEAEERVRKLEAERLERLLQDLKSGETFRLGSACSSLAFMRPNDRRAEVVPLLEPLLSHSDAFVRARAAEALGQWGTGDVVAKIQPLLNDKDRSVRDTAKRVLDKLQGRR